MPKKILTVASAALLTLSLASCAGGNAGNTSQAETGSAGQSQTQAQNSAPATGTAASAVKLTDGWAKAGTKTGMTGAFGVIENTGSSDIVLTGVESTVAGDTEMHEVVEGKMREIEGDITIAAGQSYVLEPGANHIMFMGLNRDLLAGEEVEVRLEFSDNSEATFKLLVKEYSGANEEYSDLEHGEHDHDHSTDQNTGSSSGHSHG